MSVDKIKQLREQTGLSFSLISKTLQECDGDVEKTLNVLREHGASVAEKKAARATREGIVASYTHSNGKIAAICELLCETDFVARNPLFLELGRELAMQIAAMDPKDNDELLEQDYIKKTDVTVGDLINKFIGQLGENIKVGKFARLSL